MPTNPDTELVHAAAAGDRDAFGRLVARHQGAVCAVTYARAGSVHASEDLAQETFLTAWRKLGELRQPETLRAWLCGIARNLSRDRMRRDLRAGALPDGEARLAQQASDDPSPRDAAISEEEAQLLWRTLEDIPETYRESLVLFYREDQSVRDVAKALDLSEDAVKQRLSRGRKLLRDEMAARIEELLGRSKPGTAFGVAVLAALPVGRAASAGVVTAGGVTKASMAAGAGAAGGILGSGVGLLGGLFGSYMGIRNTYSLIERRFAIRMTVTTHAGVFTFLGLLGLAYWFFRPEPIRLGIAQGALWAFYVPALITAIVLGNRRHRQVKEKAKNIEPGSAEETAVLESWGLTRVAVERTHYRGLVVSIIGATCFSLLGFYFFWWMGASILSVMLAGIAGYHALVRWGLDHAPIKYPDPPEVPAPGEPVEPPSFGHMIGALVGSTVGLMAWPLVMALRAGDWTSGALALGYAALVIAVAILHLRRNPDARRRTVGVALFVLGACTTLLVGLRWDSWEVVPANAPLVDGWTRLSMLAVYSLATFLVPAIIFMVDRANCPQGD
jgi:RNA polymerase sigma factor (sigma-70 family)